MVVFGIDDLWCSVHMIFIIVCFSLRLVLTALVFGITGWLCSSVHMIFIGSNGMSKALPPRTADVMHTAQGDTNSELVWCAGVLGVCHQ